MWGVILIANIGFLKFMRWWKSKVTYQMLSYCFCIFRINIITPSWIMPPLAVMLLFSSYKFVGFMFLPLLFTSLVVLVSTFLYMWKHKVGEGNGFSLSTTSEDKKITLARENIANIAPTTTHKNEKTLTQTMESQEEQVSDDDNETAPSESECQQGLFLSTFENYEDVDQNQNQDHTAEDSDGTISDEDSLIEIALPSGHFMAHNHHKEDSNSSKYNCSLQQKKRELSAETLFNQQSLMEFLAEFNDMNEEENLIEIDIAMGSIKCSRFEIEA